MESSGGLNLVVQTDYVELADSVTRAEKGSGSYCIDCSFVIIHFSDCQR
jgi:hypothetical protein